MYDCDFCLANRLTICKVQHDRAPSLLVAWRRKATPMSGPTSGNMGCPDRTRKMMSWSKEGTHGMGNCTACEGGRYHNLREASGITSQSGSTPAACRFWLLP